MNRNTMLIAEILSGCSVINFSVQTVVTLNNYEKNMKNMSCLCWAMQLNFKKLKGHIGTITHTFTQTAYQVTAKYFATLISFLCATS